ncbi:MAG: hypothetical protein RLZZ32_166 [Cyanobacteriota bacterium]|jgi:hypothetical protein
MGSQWENFLCNLGEWRGSFTGVSAAGELLESTPSILSLESDEDDRLVRFRLRRFGPEGYDAEPIHDMAQDYRSLGRQVVFFDNGTFCKGTLQVSPGSEFGAEFGFVDGDRRHRLVQLHHSDGSYKQAVLIREFRSGTDACEQPFCSPASLTGEWQGEAATISADWPEPTRCQSSFRVSLTAASSLQMNSVVGSEAIDRSITLQNDRLGIVPGEQTSTLQWLPDGGFLIRPDRVTHRQSFVVEAGWLPSPDRLIRLIRRYDASGAWQSATQVIATRS